MMMSDSDGKEKRASTMKVFTGVTLNCMRTLGIGDVVRSLWIGAFCRTIFCGVFEFSLANGVSFLRRYTKAPPVLSVLC